METQTETPEREEPAAKAAEAPKEAKPVTAVPVALDRGVIAPRDASELNRTLEMLAKGNAFPECFDSPPKRLAAYNVARALMGDQWPIALNHLAYIKGKLMMYGELPGAIAQRTGDLQSKEMYLITKDYQRICIENKNLDAEVWGAQCTIKRGDVSNHFFYTLEEAIKAGQYPPKRRDGSPNHDSPWEKHFKVMLMRKAQAQAIKFIFPEALVGVPIAEDYDEAPDCVDVTPSKNDIAKDLNSRFAAPPREQ